MKLRFEKVRYAGLGKYKEETNHEFNEITKIIGENGTGKTTVLNSIVWALYEKNRMGETKNAKDIYNNESEETRVELELYIDKKRQVITRKRDKQDNKILKIHDKNVKEKKLESLLGIDYQLFLSLSNYEYFFNLSYPDQRKLVADTIENVTEGELIEELTEKENKVFKMLPSMEFEKEKETYKDTVKAKEQEIIHYKKQIEEIEQMDINIEESKKEVEELETKKKELNKKISGYDNIEIQNKIVEIDNEINKKKNKLEKVLRENEPELEDTRELEQNIEEIRNKVKLKQEQLKKEMDKEDIKCPNCDYVLENNYDREKIKKLSEEIKQLKKKGEKLKEKLEKTNSDNKEKKQEYEKKAEQYKKNMNEKIEKLKQTKDKLMTNEDNNVVEYEIEIEETENKIYQLKKKIDTKKEIEKIRKKKVKAIEDRNEYNEIIDIIDDIMIKKIKIKERKLNENFDNIRIKMDEKLKNRKIRKTFTLYYKTEYGAEVSGNGLSKGQRIKAHVQLSKYLKKAYGYDIPYMLDEGAELTYNIDYDTQVIIAYAKPKRLVKSDRSRWKDTDREKRIYLGLD